MTQFKKLAKRIKSFTLPAWIVVILVISPALASLAFDIDFWLGAYANFENSERELVGIPALRAISISLTAAIVSILVFLPALASIAKSHAENLQFTIIERQYVARVGDASIVLLMSFAGSLFSVMTLMNISYTLVGIQAFLLSVLLVLSFSKLSAILALSRGPESEIIDKALDLLENQMSEIVEDEENLRARAMAFEQDVKQLSSRERRIPLVFNYSLTTKDSVQIVVPTDKRISRINLEPCVTFLRDQLQDMEGSNVTLDKEKDKDISFRIKVFNPFRYGASAPNIPVLAIEYARRPDPSFDLPRIAKSASKLLEKSSKFEPAPRHAYEETRHLIGQDFADSFVKKDVRRIQRNLDLLFRLFTLPGIHSSAQREPLLMSMVSDVARAIYLAGDSFMPESTPRRLIFENIYKLVRESARRDYWFSVEQFGMAIRVLLKNEAEAEGAGSRVPLKILQSEVRSCGLTFYELIWIIRRKEEITKELEMFYAWEMFQIFRLVMDWFADAEDIRLSISIEGLMDHFLGLLERYFTSSMRDTPDVRVGVIILLSMQSYFLYKIAALDEAKSRFFLDRLFRESPPHDFPAIANRLYQSGVVDSLNWDHWPLQEIGFGGGYVFSHSKYYAECAFVFWVVNGNRQWLDRLSTSQLESLFRSKVDEHDGALRALMGEDYIEKAQELGNILRLRESEELDQVASAEVDLCQIARFFEELREVLLASEFVRFIDSLGFSMESGVRPESVFTLGMPKSWFIEEFSQFPLEPNGSVQRGIKRQLFRKFLADIDSSVEEIEVEDLDKSSLINPIIFTNFPDIGSDPLEEFAKAFLNEEHLESSCMHFRICGLEKGIWITDADSVEVLASREQLSDWEKLPSNLIGKMEVSGDRADLELRFNGAFRIKSGGRVVKVTPAAAPS